MNKKQIDAIYPLSFSQNGLLLHHLEESKDQGIIQVQFELKGKLNFELFKKSWNSTINRHEALRSSVHYQKIKTPVRIVHKEVEFSLSRHDFEGFSSEEQQLKLTEFKSQDRINGIDLSTTPTFRVHLFQLSDNSHSLIWTCHHIILDGWSSMNVCKDLLQFYEYFIEDNTNVPIDLDTLPKYKSYLNWLKKQDANAVKDFWKSYFEGFKIPSLFSNSKNNLSTKFESINFVTDEVKYKKLKSFLLKHKLTENAFIQGIWALLLCKYFKINDVSFGTITSGRIAEIPNMELMADMFTNLIPVRVKINRDLSFFEFVKELQIRQLKTHDYNYAHLNEITSWAGLGNHKAIFDSLLIVENYPKDKKQYKHLNIDNYKSNVTSSMPISLAVKSSDYFEFLLKFNSSQIPSEFANNLVLGLKKLVSHIIDNENFSFTVSSLLDKLNDKEYQLLVHEPIEIKRNKKKSLKKKTTISETESILLEIWQYLFNHNDIGLEDDFFELGGTSFQAIKLSSLIKEKLGFNFKPTTLIKRRSIKSIAILIDNADHDENKTWRSLVTLNETGDKTPLFCLHSEGGYTLVYKTFANHFINKRPVYSIQPKGLDGVSPLHKSIEELAEDYIKEMQTVQPNGPYFILSYCWIPSAIANEIAVKLNAMGAICNIIAVDSNFYNSKRQRNIGKLLAVLRCDIVRIKILIKEVNFKLNQWKSINYKENKTKQKKEDEQIRIIKKVDNNIAKFFRSYKAKPIDGGVLCIISASFMKHHKYEINPRTWKKIATRGFEKVILESDHGTIFREPSVKPLYKVIESYMDTNQNDN
jgi:thioesterase domain-containing protein/acyl carrier protein